MTGYGHSWHQSHDQATVLLLVPYDTLPEDVTVQIEQNALIAGVRDQPPLIKGRLYAPLVPSASSWQLEPRIRHNDHERIRTTSTASTISNASSFAVVSSDPEISSSFAASLASGPQSVADDYVQTSPYPHQAQNTHSPPFSHPQTPIRAESPRALTSSWTSSLSSRSSLQLHAATAGRLLTIYLEKAEPGVIWPSIIVGPVSVHVYAPLPGPPGATDINGEEKYNMDAVSLGVMGVEHMDADRREEAFEYFVRAWHQTHTALSTLRLTTYLPVSSTIHLAIDSDPEPATNAYYLHRLGGLPGLARLYLEAGLLYLEGNAEMYLSSTSPKPSADNSSGESVNSIEGERWREEKEIARKFFERAKMLDPHADVPTLPADPSPEHANATPAKSSGDEFQMPDSVNIEEKPRRRRRKPEQQSMVEQITRGVGGLTEEDTDATWYLYLPGLIGAGTALLVVGLVGAMSYGNWRKNQSS